MYSMHSNYVLKLSRWQRIELLCMAFGRSHISDVPINLLICLFRALMGHCEREAMQHMHNRDKYSTQVKYGLEPVA